jgi:hypothetical protein
MAPEQLESTDFILIGVALASFMNFPILRSLYLNQAADTCHGALKVLS